MKISICIPCMNRVHDLELVMPSLIEAANNSPPVEIVILDYNSQDQLRSFIEHTASIGLLNKGNTLTYAHYTGNDYYHMAHARNLSVQASCGDYVLISSADVYMLPNYLVVMRQKISEGYVWIHHSDRYVGVICIKRQEFIDAGGFDERFEFYGKEDKDLVLRLRRRGAAHTRIPDLLELIYTPWSMKLANYRGSPSRREVGKRSKKIYLENIDRGVLVANTETGWGKWE